METVDVVVIGAGFHGLAAAATYLALYPSANLVIHDSNSSIGGVWASHRLYKGLKSNNLIGTYEFPGFPMDPEVFGVKSGEHIPGDVVHKYLVAYAEHHHLPHRIRLMSKIESAKRHPSGSGWILDAHDLASSREGRHKTIETSKLIVATGMASDPLLPTFKNNDVFDAPIIHCKDLHSIENSDALAKVKSVVVLGGSKSAWDAVYDFATRGVEVHWVIRESGHGPIWMAPSHVTPLKKWLEKLVHTRFLTLFSPCPWGPADGQPGLRNFLHNTWVGRSIVDTFWGILGSDVVSLNQYDKHPETAKLKPWYDAFYADTKLSILNYEQDFFKLVRESGKIKIHIADIEKLEDYGVVLSGSGNRLEADALICSTGWNQKPPLSFFTVDEKLDQDLGLPGSLSYASEGKQALVDEVDEDILKAFPKLRARPVPNKHFKPITDMAGIKDTPGMPSENSLNTDSFNLYRFMVPSTTWEKRDLAFAGAMSTISTSLCSSVQALWIAAYLNNDLLVQKQLASPLSDHSVSSKMVVPQFPYLPRMGVDSKSWDFQGQPGESRIEVQKEIEYSTLLHNRYFEYRYPTGFRSPMPDFVFDALPYMDMLLTDMGLEKHRKGINVARGAADIQAGQSSGGVFSWVKELFNSYGPEDYVGLIDEYRIKNRLV